jgi:hypothetical protein
MFNQMAKSKTSQKLKKLNFTNRDRRIEPMTINDKYLLKTIEGIKHENIQRTTGRGLRSQHT